MLTFKEFTEYFEELELLRSIIKDHGSEFKPLLRQLIMSSSVDSPLIDLLKELYQKMQPVKPDTPAISSHRKEPFIISKPLADNGGNV